MRIHRDDRYGLRGGDCCGHDDGVVFGGKGGNDDGGGGRQGWERRPLGRKCQLQDMEVLDEDGPYGQGFVGGGRWHGGQVKR